VNPETLLQAFENRLAEENVLQPHLKGEVIIQGDRAEIIFQPEVAKSNEERVARMIVKGAIQEACIKSEEGKITEVEPMLGHIGLSGVTDDDLNAIHELPGVFLVRTAA
jgi:hypothetical protein